MDQGLGIEFPKIWGNLEPMRGLRLVPNIPGSNHRTVLGPDPQRKFAHRVDPAEQFPAGSCDGPVGDGAVPVDRLPGKNNALAAEINRSKKFAQQFSLSVRNKNKSFKERAYS
jgi:hypothetical protein